MPSSNVKDLLSCFSPTLSHYAVSSGDGRIKIWDTLKGNLQTEIADLGTAASDFLQPKSEDRQLSFDYKCIQWVELKEKSNGKTVQSLLVLGTGSGDVVALDVSTAQQKWRVSDCHPGGVSTLSKGGTSSIYTAGLDGMVCKLDPSTGNLLGKFKASSKPISSLAVSADGRVLATASSQIKVFSCYDNMKIQKFSGHPVGVRCMTFSEDGNNILSSATGEKFIALWRVDGSKNHTSYCVFSMEHPAVSIDLKGSSDAGFFILAISEAGICYFWHGRTLKELSSITATKISVVAPDALSKKISAPPAIYSARFQNIIRKSASGHVMVSYGSHVKPCFEKVCVQNGSNVNIHYSQEGALFRQLQHHASHKEQAQMRVTTLDRVNAEDAAIPFPNIHNYQDKKRKHDKLGSILDLDTKMVDTGAQNHEASIMGNEGLQENFEDECNVINLENMLKSHGILSVDRGIKSELEKAKVLSAFSESLSLHKARSLIHDTTLTKQTKETLLKMFENDASKCLEFLLLTWNTRLASERNILLWICNFLSSYKRHFQEESSRPVINSLRKMTSFKSTATEALLQLSGRLQLITAQMGNPRNADANMEDYVDNSEEEVDEVVFGFDDDSSENADE